METGGLKFGVGRPQGSNALPEGKLADSPANPATLRLQMQFSKGLRPTGCGQPPAGHHKARTRTKLARPGHARLNCTRTRRPFTVTTAATFKRRGNRWPACGTNPDPESTGRSSTPPSLAKSPAEKSATTWRAPTSAKSTGGACQSGGAVAAGRGCKRPLCTAYSTNFPPRRSTAYGFPG